MSSFQTREQLILWIKSLSYFNLQEELREKDFDIRKSAGGHSNVVVMMNYTANVTENFLEIHLFWAGKGTCCIPIQGYYGPSISAIGVTPGPLRSRLITDKYLVFVYVQLIYV